MITNNFQEEMIIALNALKENAELTIDMSKKWQNKRVINLYEKDIELAEKLLKVIGEFTNWRTDEPPQDTTFIADVGMPYSVICMWNKHHEGYVCAMIEINMMQGEWSDPYFENEWDDVEVKAWMPLPELPNGNQIKDNDEILKAREAV